MGHSRSLRTYDDCKELFDAAVAQNGIRITCTRGGQAVNLRARLNHFRTLDRESMAEIYPTDHPKHGISAYDPFVIRLDNLTLTIEPRGSADYTIEPLEASNAIPSNKE
jgi:hypothetical protein